LEFFGGIKRGSAFSRFAFSAYKSWSASESSFSMRSPSPRYVICDTRGERRLLGIVGENFGYDSQHDAHRLLSIQGEPGEFVAAVCARYDSAQ